MLPEQRNYYHNPTVLGFWTEMCVFYRDIMLRDGSMLKRVIPIGIREHDGTLEMVLSTFEGNVYESIDHFPGLTVVRGDSQNHPYEKDDELLIEFTYFHPRTEQMETQPRRVRPTAIMFGIHGDTDLESYNKGSHRARGESADYYLEGVDTQYDPKKDPNEGLRRFPFWRSRILGDPIILARKYLPEPPPAE